MTFHQKIQLAAFEPARTEECDVVVILSEAKDHLATLDSRKKILRFAQDDNWSMRLNACLAPEARRRVAEVREQEGLSVRWLRFACHRLPSQRTSGAQFINTSLAPRHSLAQDDSSSLPGSHR